MTKPKKLDAGGSKAFEPVANVFSADPRVSSMKAFGSLGLKVNGKVFAIDWKGKLVVKLPAARASELVAARKAKAFDPGHGRPMKEWVAFASDSGDWKALAREARAYVATGAK